MARGMRATAGAVGLVGAHTRHPSAPCATRWILGRHASTRRHTPHRTSDMANEHNKKECGGEGGGGGETRVQQMSKGEQRE
jgi:hypothetical protein